MSANSIRVSTPGHGIDRDNVSVRIDGGDVKSSNSSSAGSELENGAFVSHSIPSLHGKAAFPAEPLWRSALTQNQMLSCLETGHIRFTKDETNDALSDSFPICLWHAGMTICYFSF